jgi:hypothetical protein
MGGSLTHNCNLNLRVAQEQNKKQIVIMFIIMCKINVHLFIL